jgi:ABC-type enterochelin transport system substrate-binding protein
MRNRTTTTAAALAAGLLMLSACSRSEPEQPIEENMTEQAPVDEATPDAPPTVEPSATPTVAVDSNTAAIDTPPEAPVAPDAQMIDDADATGMTARVSRDEAPAGNDQAAQ